MTLITSIVAQGDCGVRGCVVMSCVYLCTEGGSTGSIDQQQHGSSFSHLWVLPLTTDLHLK